LLQKIRERGIDRREADGLTVLEGSLSEVLGKGTFADAARSSEQDVVPVSGIPEQEELLIEGTVNRSRETPVEAIERLHRTELCALRARGEIARLAFASFELDDLFEDLDRR
jgi:hypothetical protein